MKSKKRNLLNELKQGITEINDYDTKKITLLTSHIKERSIKSDLKRLDALKDDDIDYSDNPALDNSFFERETILLSKVTKEKIFPVKPLIPNEETIKAMRAARNREVFSVKNIDNLFNELNVDG